MKWKFDTENHIFMTAAVAFDINYYSCHSKKQWNATIWDWLTIFLYYADFWAPQEKAVLCVCVCVFFDYWALRCAVYGKPVESVLFCWEKLPCLIVEIQ